VKLIGPIYQNAIAVVFDIRGDPEDSDIAYQFIRDIFNAVNQAAREGRLD
jgi:hypothetical protein